MYQWRPDFFLGVSCKGNVGAPIQGTPIYLPIFCRQVVGMCSEVGSNEVPKASTIDQILNFEVVRSSFRWYSWCMIANTVLQLLDVKGFYTENELLHSNHALLSCMQTSKDNPRPLSRVMLKF